VKPQPRAHNVLRDGGDGPIVVMSDFAAAGRPTAQFPALVPRLSTQAAFWETAPPAPGSEGRMTGDDYGNRWLADIASDGRQVVAVAGFCSGSVYAGWLADRLGRVQRRPQVILFDPEPATKAMVLEDFEKLVTVRMADLIPEDESREAMAAAHQADHETGDDALALTDALAALCRGVVREGFVRTGKSAHRCDEFIALFIGYLRWFAGACAVSDFRGWDGATVLLSTTPEIGLQATPEHVRRSLVGEVVNVDVPHFDLLRSEVTAQRVDELLSASNARVRPYASTS
jgi:hypothetical protein